MTVAGTHRSPRARQSRPRPRRSRILAALVVAVVAGSAAGIGVVLVQGAAKNTAGVGIAAPSTPTPQPTVEPVAVAPVAPPPPPHDPVSAAAPSHFQIAGPGFTVDANVCRMPNIRPLDPPGDQYHTVCWVYEGFGVAPSSASGGTSYILGHSWAQAPLVLNPLSEFAMNDIVNQPVTMLDGIRTQQTASINGYTITLTVPGGVLTYGVTRTYAVDKNDAGRVASLMAERTPDRIVLITCAVHDGRDIEQNVIVEAYLTSSRAA